MMKLTEALVHPFLFLWILSSSGDVVAQSRTFYVVNNCPFPIWPALTPSQGHSVVAGGGFYLPSRQSLPFQVPGDWSGRIWARTGCNFSSNSNPACETGDCNGQLQCNGIVGVPPATLLEIQFQFEKAKPNFYDVSVVDGFNLPMSVTTNPAAANCQIGGCTASLRGGLCPQELQVQNGGGQVVACKSACLAFNLDAYCCRNGYGTPEKCKPSAYSQLFKNACPSYISYAYDTPSPLANCYSDEYFVTFCPNDWAAAEAAADADQIASEPNPSAR